MMSGFRTFLFGVVDSRRHFGEQLPPTPSESLEEGPKGYRNLSVAYLLPFKDYFPSSCV